VIALAALCGVLIAGGLWAMFAGINSHTPTVPKLSTQLWTIPVDRLRRRTAIILAASLLAGGFAAVFTGWWLLVLIAPAVALVLPLLLSAPQNRELELLQAIDRWVRMLGSLLTTGRSIVDAVRISSRQAPMLLSPSLHRLTARLDERWTIEQALLAMADELDSPDADAVLAALALAAQRGGTGASATLAALADSLQDRLRALREISTERAKPRFVVRQVTLITATVLGLALIFGGTFFAPFGSPTGQLLLAVLVGAYLGSLLFLRRMTLPRRRQRILGRAS
jgi:Flp pilus assembly protein TadB